MITEEEEERIIKKTLERALLVLPETVSHLLTSQMALNKLTSKFYADYPEFKDKKDIVTKVLEGIDTQDPTEDYEEMLKKAVPEIRKRVNTLKNLDFAKISSDPNRDFKGVGEI